MKRETLSPDSLHAPFSTYVHGIAVDEARRVIFSAGQVCGDKDGGIVGVGDFEAQGEQVMKNLTDVLAEGGATFSDIIKVTIYVVGQQYAQPARDLCRRHWDKSNPPASTLIVCAGLANPDFLIEIEAIAII
ncbi:MAG: RidA family protein [Rhodospirillales bacterium]|mgnify:CR=1 FL=1|nr:RidA family protein [Rhodospirillales bacterium]MDP6646453.1 RidA family protein [Rhodospirillales bacterium]